MIKENLKKILTILISFNGKTNLKESIELTENYLQKYAKAENIESFIVK